METLRPAVTVFAARPARRAAGIRCSNRTRVTHTRRSGSSARQEAVTEATPNWERLQSASTRPRGKGVPTPNPARRRAQARHPNRVLRITPRVHAKFSSSADLVIEVSGVPTRQKGTLGAPGAHHVRRTGGCAESSEVGTLERAITPKPEDDHLLRPLGFERLERDQARGSCETSLLNRAAPSRAHRAR